MSRKPPRSSPASAPAVQTYRAGCQRTWQIASDEGDLAYTEQAFPECPTCPHRVEPEGEGRGEAAPFCTLRPASTPHPFAALAGLMDGLE